MVVSFGWHLTLLWLIQSILARHGVLRKHLGRHDVDVLPLLCRRLLCPSSKDAPGIVPYGGVTPSSAAVQYLC